MSDEPEEFEITPLARGAAELHEIYCAYINAGFTEARAFDLATTVLLNFLES